MPRGLANTPPTRHRRPPQTSRRPTLPRRVAQPKPARLVRSAFSGYGETSAQFLGPVNSFHVLPMCCSPAESDGPERYQTAQEGRGLEWSRGLGGQPTGLVGVFPGLARVQIPFPAPPSLGNAGAFFLVGSPRLRFRGSSQHSVNNALRYKDTNCVGTPMSCRLQAPRAGPGPVSSRPAQYPRSLIRVAVCGASKSDVF